MTLPSPDPSDSSKAVDASEAQSASSDEPEAAVEPIYLRPGRNLRGPRPPAKGRAGAPLAAPEETLVDAITRIVSEMLATSLRESVEAAVRALAPRMVISFTLQPATPADVAAASADDLAIDDGKSSS